MDLLAFALLGLDWAAVDQWSATAAGGEAINPPVSLLGLALLLCRPTAAAFSCLASSASATIYSHQLTSLLPWKALASLLKPFPT